MHASPSAEGGGQLPFQAEIVPEDVVVETLFDRATDFTESAAAGHDSMIYFSDIVHSTSSDGIETAHIWRYGPRMGNSAIFRSPSGKSNGIVFDRAGRMMVAEGPHSGCRITRTHMSLEKSYILAAE